MKRCLGIIEDICKEKNIELKKYSNDWIFSLKREKKISYIVGYKFDLNSRIYDKNL